MMFALIGCDRILGITDPHGVGPGGDSGVRDGNGSGDGNTMPGDGKVADGAMTACGGVAPVFGGAKSNGATGAVAVAVADLDTNGSPDLAVAVQTDIGVMFNDGTGTFSPTRKIRPGEDVAADDVLVADVDGDGRNDVVSVSSGVLSVNLHDSSSKTAFLAADSIPSTLSTTAMFAGQMDGSGGKDLVITDGSKTNLLLSIGGAAFTVSASFSGRAVGIADVDGDGKLDVLAIINNNQPAVAFGDGAGGLGAVTAVGTGSPVARRFAPGVFSTDAHRALIADDGSGGIRVIRQTAARTFGAQTLLFQHLPGEPGGAHGLEIADINADSRDDVVGNGALVTQCPGPPGTIAQMTDMPVELGIANPIQTILVDVDNDTHPDAVQVDAQNSGVFVSLQQ